MQVRVYPERTGILVLTGRDVDLTSGQCWWLRHAEYSKLNATSLQLLTTGIQVDGAIEHMR